MSQSSGTKAQTIIEAAEQAGSFTTLLAAVDAADLTKTLNDRTSAFTVFAPTDAAFEAVDADTLSDLLTPGRKADLQRILKHHVVKGRMDGKSVATRKTIRPLGGGEIPVRTEGEKVFLGDAQISQADIETGNGVIHVIDAVLMPTAKKM